MPRSLLVTLALATSACCEAPQDPTDPASSEPAVAAAAWLKQLANRNDTLAQQGLTPVLRVELTDEVFSQTIDRFSILRSHDHVRWVRVHYRTSEPDRGWPERCIDRLSPVAEVEATLVEADDERQLELAVVRSDGNWRFNGVQVDGRRLDFKPRSKPLARRGQPRPLREPQPVGPDPEPAPVAPGGPLAVKVSGEPVEIADAVAGSFGGRAVWVVLSDRPLTCDVTKLGWLSIERGQKLIHLTVAPLWIRRAGDRWVKPSNRWSVTHSSWPGGSGIGGGIVTVPDGFGAAGSTAPLRIEYSDAFKVNDSRIDVRGSIDVRGCGARKLPGAARPQPELEVSVAGDPLPIQGARLTSRGGNRTKLLFASTPLDCNNQQLRHDTAVAVNFSDGVPEDVWAEGARFGTSLGLGRAGLTVALDPPTGDTVTGTVDISETIGGPAGVHVLVRGRFNALRCLDDD